MAVGSNKVEWIYNTIAVASNWLLLAGFIVFPGTFISLSRAGVLGDSQVSRVFQNTIRNTPLLYIGAFWCLIGACGIWWVWWHIWDNYIWLIYRVFL